MPLRVPSAGLTIEKLLALELEFTAFALALWTLCTFEVPRDLMRGPLSEGPCGPPDCGRRRLAAAPSSSIVSPFRTSPRADSVVANHRAIEALER